MKRLGGFYQPGRRFRAPTRVAAWLPLLILAGCGTAPMVASTAGASGDAWSTRIMAMPPSCAAAPKALTATSAAERTPARSAGRRMVPFTMVETPSSLVPGAPGVCPASPVGAGGPARILSPIRTGLQTIRAPSRRGAGNGRGPRPHGRGPRARSAWAGIRRPVGHIPPRDASTTGRTVKVPSASDPIAKTV